MNVQARAALLAWFDQYKRDLPWRRTRDPYAIWISEIMLQQTRVAAVLEHYARWIERFPTIAALAAVEEPDVLALWSGLGYYRRARMLHRAARIVIDEYGGMLPQTAAELRRLPGIGEYTSAAIASIAFNESIAVVDGNVERVVTRLLGSTPVKGEFESQRAKTSRVLAPPKGKAIREGAASLLSAARPGDANQAMMELGATVCLPKVPLCLYCPLQPWCRTRGKHAVVARKPLITRDVAYLLSEREDPPRVLLRQRPADASLMAGMWELPELPEIPTGAEPAVMLRHAITVTNYRVSVVRGDARLASTHEKHLHWAALPDLGTLPLTGLTRKVLRKLRLWTA